jgi:O-antigen biosynthesis protein
VLVIDAVTPEPDKDSGSMRMLAMLTIARHGLSGQLHAGEPGLDRPLHAQTCNSAAPRFCSAPLGDQHRRLAARARPGSLDLVHGQPSLRARAPDDSIRKHCPNARVIFDTVDLHFLREERMAESPATSVRGAWPRRPARPNWP